MRRAYRVLLRLYPYDYRMAFASEMSSLFERAAGERRAQGRAAQIRFTFVELAGVVIGAASEWMAKLTTSRSLRGRSLPDLRMMRPPSVPWDLWGAGARRTEKQGNGCSPDI